MWMTYFLNTLGGIIGYYWMAHFNKFLPTRDEIDKKTYENAKNSFRAKENNIILHRYSTIYYNVIIYICYIIGETNFQNIFFF